MRLEILAPFLGDLDGKCEYFQAEWCRKLQTHLTARNAPGGRMVAVCQRYHLGWEIAMKTPASQPFRNAPTTVKS
jgi:hypothetical protein